MKNICYLNNNQIFGKTNKNLCKVFMTTNFLNYHLVNARRYFRLMFAGYLPLFYSAIYSSY